MKKRRRPGAKKAAKGRRKPIMRHSREGARSRRTKKRAKPAARRRKASRKASPARRKKSVKPIRRAGGEAAATIEPPPDERGMGAESGGQSGDTEGLSRAEEAGQGREKADQATHARGRKMWQDEEAGKARRSPP